MPDSVRNADGLLGVVVEMHQYGRTACAQFTVLPGFVADGHGTVADFAQKGADFHGFAVKQFTDKFDFNAGNNQTPVMDVEVGGK